MTFHTLWGKAHGHPDYVKAEWMALQRLVERPVPSKAMVKAALHLIPKPEDFFEHFDKPLRVTGSGRSWWVVSGEERLKPFLDRNGCENAVEMARDFLERCEARRVSQ